MKTALIIASLALVTIAFPQQPPTQPEVAQGGNAVAGGIKEPYGKKDDYDHKKKDDYDHKKKDDYDHKKKDDYDHKKKDDYDHKKKHKKYEDEKEYDHDHHKKHDKYPKYDRDWKKYEYDD